MHTVASLVHSEYTVVSIVGSVELLEMFIITGKQFSHAAECNASNAAGKEIKQAQRRSIGGGVRACVLRASVRFAV